MAQCVAGLKCEKTTRPAEANVESKGVINPPMVKNGWAIMGGIAVVLFGNDPKGRALDVVGLKKVIFYARLRLEPGVKIYAASEGGQGPSSKYLDEVRFPPKVTCCEDCRW